MTTDPGVRYDPSSIAWNRVATFNDYDSAQAAVDRLSDDGFPVEQLDIVGTNLRTVEHVTGRFTNGRAAAVGAGQGAWFGLLVGLLVGLFTAGPTWLGLVLGGLVIGALWGAVVGLLGHAMWRGRRDFSSTKSLVAAQYDVLARGGTADQARQMLQAAGIVPATG